MGMNGCSERGWHVLGDAVAVATTKAAATKACTIFMRLPIPAGAATHPAPATVPRPEGSRRSISE